MRYGEVMRPLDLASIELPEHLKLDPDVARYLVISRPGSTSRTFVDATRSGLTITEMDRR